MAASSAAARLLCETLSAAVAARRSWIPPAAAAVVKMHSLVRFVREQMTLLGGIAVVVAGDVAVVFPAGCMKV